MIIITDRIRHGTDSYMTEYFEDSFGDVTGPASCGRIRG